MTPRPVGAAVGRRSWRRLWLWASLLAASGATTLDAVLLQRDRSFFTGGFLAVDYIRTFWEATLFVLGSLAADLGALAPLAALVLWVAGRVGASPVAAVVAAACVAALPVAVSDFVSYELASYLGDAFDLGLMFSLAGRDVTEILAVAAAHVSTILLYGLLLVALAIGVALLARRRTAERTPWPDRPTFGGALVLPLVLLGVAAVGTTTLRRGSDVLDNGLRRKPTGQWLGLSVNRLSDVDGDGYGLLGRPPDNSLFDPRVRPYALDLPGNGVDEDGVAGDLPAGSAPYLEPPGAAPVWAHRPDVVLVVLESFRADAVGARVDGRPVTPVLDALAKDGISVPHAYSHNGYTVQARHHLFSGSLADVRGGTTLIDDFNANGYQTAYFSGQDESFGGAEFGVGFERADVAYDARVDRDRRYSRFTTAGSLAVPYSVLLERVTAFVDRRSREKPLFLYVNFHDTHFPYHHAGIEALVNRTPLAQADIGPGRAADLRATYLNTAANVDRAIGQVLAAARRSLGHQPGVIVVADHGESLFDEGFLGHGYALNEAQTRVPLIAANLPIPLPEPFGQSDLRDAIRAALAAPPPDGNTPVLVTDPGRHVFQYLGSLERPAQIALTGAGSQIAYDFRDARVRVNGGSWLTPARLPPADATNWHHLVATWERMVIARREHRRRAS